MNYSKAFLAGVTGGAVMSLIITLVRVLGIMDVNLAIMEGSMVLGTASAAAWILGLIMHLIISGLIALLYAAGFEYLTHRAGWLIGLAISLIHIVIAGLFFGIVPAMHPLMPDQIPPPGIFMSNKGIMGVLAFFMLHMIYAAVVGAIYRPVHTAGDYRRLRSV
jgi:hypothetical protein